MFLGLMLLIQLAKEEVLAGMTGPDYQEKIQVAATQWTIFCVMSNNKSYEKLQSFYFLKTGALRILILQE